jgi:hypothetical protein
MSSLLGNQSPPATGTEPALDNNGFWPAVEPQATRQAARLDGTVTPARLRLALQLAMADVNAELAAWQATQQAAGHSTAAEVPAPQVDGQSAHLVHYRMAIVSHVQAGLAERNRDMDTTGAGDRLANELEPTADAHRRNVHWCISRIVGRSRSTVELI